MNHFLPVTLPQDIEPPRFFSPMSPTEVMRGGDLPHWEQSRATAFVTFRLADSLPQSRLKSLTAERNEWLDSHPEPWDDATRQLHDSLFSARVEAMLDSGLGSCALQSYNRRSIVEACLRRFDGIRYRLYAYAVMPNHVHVVFMPLGEETIVSTVQAWKSVSARELIRSGCGLRPIWQREYFDRYIRNAEHFARAMRYTKRNDERISWWACIEE